jgi:hypothetical protein
VTRVESSSTPLLPLSLLSPRAMILSSPGCLRRRRVSGGRQCDDPSEQSKRKV